jgi:DNA polymerase/3'-5' exonuclease PolX
MSEAEPRPIEEARRIAETVVEMIRDCCEVIQIAGSIRRGKPLVKDAEIVCIPRDTLWHRLDLLVQQRKLEKAMYAIHKKGQPITYQPRWGDKYRGVCLPGDDMKIEIFTANKDTYGYQLWLRTGPSKKNEELVTTLKYLSPFLAREGYIWLEREEDLTDGSRRISVPDEEAFFRLLNIPFEQPHERGQHYDLLKAISHRWGKPEQLLEEPKAEPKQVKLL